MTRVEKLEREGLHAVLETLDNGYPAELRGEPQRFAAFRARWLGNDPASFGAIYRMLVDMDLRPELPRIECPVLVTAASSIAAGRRTGRAGRAAIPGARYKVLPTGHYAPVQTPELYARTIGEFLDAVGA